MENLIDVYHSTNKSAYEKIIKSGFIGLDRNDYSKITEEIIELTGTKISKEKLMEKFFDKESSESNGGVSFFQRRESCEQIANLYNEGGEWLNLFLKSTLKYISRVDKVPYEVNKEKIGQFFSNKTEPVILHFQIPERLIANKNRIGGSYELYTLEKISTSYLVDAYFLESNNVKKVKIK